MSENINNIINENKKIRIAIYKMLIYIPKLITGNYKRKQRNII